MQPPFTRIQLNPENKPFADMMANGKSYEIPDFQRDYSWEEDQWNELWEDITTAMKERKQHFMGYLVLQTEDGKNFKIIDGQQRITTLSVIFLAGISRLNKLDEKEIEPAENSNRINELTRNYIGYTDPISLKHSPKLALNRSNNTHYQQLVRDFSPPQKRNISVTNRKLNKAFDFFAQKMAHYQNGKEITILLVRIADAMLFTTITVDDDMNAYTVFETLNARGMHLSTPDLLKNYLLSVLSSNQKLDSSAVEDFSERWAGIIEQLGEANFTNFLRSHMGMSNPLQRKNHLYKALKNQISSYSQVLPFLKDIEQSAPLYAALQNPNDDYWSRDPDIYREVRPHLELLRTFSIKTPLSLLMASYRRFSAQDFIKITEKIASLSIRYNVIGGQGAQEQERVYNRIAMAIHNDNLLYGDVIQRLKPLYPSDQDFKSRFAEKSMPSRQSAKKILFLLRKIEQRLNKTEIPTNGYSIEHILPFSPEDHWQEYFGRDNYRAAINRLGNMVVLPTSQNLGQEDFSCKKKILYDTPFQINQKIAEYDYWNIEALNDYQKWLAKHAVNTWRIEQLT